MTTITRENLEIITDFNMSKGLVTDTIRKACENEASLLLFSQRYTYFNSYFGSNVAKLAGTIGCSGYFRDYSEPLQCLSDRNVLVGSYFFDAARDEFDDRDTIHRDTHRCLAQAFLSGIIKYYFNNWQTGIINKITEFNTWTKSLKDIVAAGYRAADTYGYRAADTYLIFKAMGYHLGSEILADFEFTCFDNLLCALRPDLVTYMKCNTVNIAGQNHNMYSWLSLHSTYNKGGAKEVEHFNWATQGVNVALQFTKPEERAVAIQYIYDGYEKFFSNHTAFFKGVLND